MSRRSSLSWPKWEENNLLPWLKTNKTLSWDARAEAYCKQYGIHRTVESIRGKKYHILRKQRLSRAKASEQRPDAKRRRRLRRLGGPKEDLAELARAKNDKIGEWLERIPSEMSTPPMSRCTTEETHSGPTTPSPDYPRPHKTQFRFRLWDKVHRICATKGLYFHRQ